MSATDLLNVRMRDRQGDTTTILAIIVQQCRQASGRKYSMQTRCCRAPVLAGIQVEVDV